MGSRHHVSAGLGANYCRAAAPRRLAESESMLVYARYSRKISNGLVHRFVMFILATLAIGAMALTTASLVLKPKSVGPAAAPDPAHHSDAVVQVYGADVWGVRGRFAIHTWIALKAANAERYTRYQVIGWRQRRGLSVVSISNGNPDGDWFGSKPTLLLDHRGAAAEDLIESVHAAALSYPLADEYVMWPGPNSNSFTAWISLEVPELGLDLPTKAIGKSWMVDAYPALQN